MKRLFKGLVLALGLFLIPGETMAAEKSARALVENLFNEGMEILRADASDGAIKTKPLQAVLERYFDDHFISEFALGSYRRSFTPAQKETYRNIFTPYIITIFKPQLEKIAREDGGRLQVLREEYLNSGDTIVTTNLMRGVREPLTLQWRVRKTDHGPKIVDVMYDGISLVMMLRDQFISVIKADGIDGFLNTLKAKAAALGQN